MMGRTKPAEESKPKHLLTLSEEQNIVFKRAVPRGRNAFIRQLIARWMDSQGIYWPADVNHSGNKAGSIRGPYKPKTGE